MTDQALSGSGETLPAGCRGQFTCLADYLEREADKGLFSRFRPADPRDRVYFIGADTGPVKIGLTNNPEQRLQHLQTGSPVPLKLLAVVPAGRSLERAYHRFFDSQRLSGEWFERSPILETEIRHWSRGARQHD